MTLEISQPWACAASTKADMAAGFFTLANTGASADRLIGATTPAAGTVEIHAIKVVGPDIKMQKRDNGLAFPAATTIVLKPRGYHLLMTDLAAPLVEGSKLVMTLSFEKAGIRIVEMPVQAPRVVGGDVLNETVQAG